MSLVPAFATGTCLSAVRFSPAFVAPGTAIELGRAQPRRKTQTLDSEATAAQIAIEVRLAGNGGATMARDVHRGLSATPKELSPKYFYDELGSQLFERITELPEYYPTRAER